MAYARVVVFVAAIAAALFATSTAASAFGALAIDSARGPKYGFAYNYPSAAAARAEALKKCGANCKVVVEFQNTCAAYAADQSRDNGPYGWAYAPVGENARNTALNFCRKYGGTSCLVRVWSCEGRIYRDARATAVYVGGTSVQTATRLDSVPERRPVQPPPAPIPPVANVSPPVANLPAPQPPMPVVAPANTQAVAPTTVAPRQSTALLPSPALTTDDTRRVALVVGNNDYRNLGHLQKAVNDSRAIGDALAKLGFEVIRVENASRLQMNEKIVEFARKVGRGDTAFFFYAGHGVEIKGTNYLLAVDTPPAHEGDENLIAAEGIPADSVIQQLQERGAKISVLVLDACRENPFKKEGTRGIGGTRGLAQITAPEGVFVLYSAGVGQTALDRLSDHDPNPNSVFTRTLARIIDTPGLSIQQMAKTTQAEVHRLAATVNHPQMPAYYDQILGQFTFAPRR